MVMEYSGDIQRVKEQSFLEDKSPREYFMDWCRLNDGIMPTIVSREEWDEREATTGVITQEEGKKIVLIPNDLRMWEIFPIIKAIDIDTFGNGLRAQEERTKLQDIITTFRDMGIFLKTYIEQNEWQGDEEAEALAKEMATDFYQFSRWLMFMRKSVVTYEQIPNIDDFAEEIQDQEKMKLWKAEDAFLGREAVNKRYKRLEKKVGSIPEQDVIDVERAKTLKLFFKVLVREGHGGLSAEDQDLEQRSSSQDLSWKRYYDRFINPERGVTGTEAERETLVADFVTAQPWRRQGPFFKIQQQTQFGLQRELRRPKRELEKAVARSAKKSLVEQFEVAPDKSRVVELLDEVGISYVQERKKITDVVPIARYKKRLEEMRERKMAAAVISFRELAIVGQIQKQISQLQYEQHTSLPIDVKQDAVLNCVGASLLAESLLDELGIQHFEVSVYGHATMLIVTEDGTIHYRDMLFPDSNCIVGVGQLGEEGYERLQDFIEYGAETLHLMVDREWYDSILGRTNAPGTDFIISRVSGGISPGLINNITYAALGKLGKYDTKMEPEAILALLETHRDMYPNETSVLINLVEVSIELGQFEKAREVLYTLGDVIGSENSTLADLWGKYFFEQNQFELALEAYRYVLTISPTQSEAWIKVIECLEELGRTGAYMTTIEQAMAVTDNDIFRMMLIKHHEETENYDEALFLYEEILTKYPESSALYADYHFTLAREELSEETVVNAIKALSLFGRTDQIQELIQLSKKERYDEAWPQQLEQELAA